MVVKWVFSPAELGGRFPPRSCSRPFGGFTSAVTPALARAQTSSLNLTSLPVCIYSDGPEDLTHLTKSPVSAVGRGGTAPAPPGPHSS